MSFATCPSRLCSCFAVMLFNTSRGLRSEATAPFATGGSPEFYLTRPFRPNPGRPRAVHRVGVVANLLPLKGHVDFLDMAAELTARGVEAEYWIIGEDVHRTGYKTELHNRTRELGLEDRVCFRGYCRNVPNLLRELDVVVCSSHVETFGMCVLEAMACAKPVVATSVGGLPEVVDDGVSGILVPPHAPGRLADAVERLLEDPELRITFGRFGRTRAASHFSHEVYVDKMLALYQELVPRNTLQHVLNSEASFVKTVDAL